MPELDGFSVLQAFDLESIGAIIFVTAYDQHALRAFEMHALDYLLKPFDRHRFQKALQRARTQIERARNSDFSERLVMMLEEVRAPERRPLDRLAIKLAGHVLLLKFDEIDWIEAADNYVRLHVADKTHLYRESMKSLEQQLDPNRFVRVHRSAIVNIDRIKELQLYSHGDYIVILADIFERDSLRLTHLANSSPQDS
jgi:two-component system LytT family response regulator